MTKGVKRAVKTSISLKAETEVPLAKVFAQDREQKLSIAVKTIPRWQYGFANGNEAKETGQTR